MESIGEGGLWGGTIRIGHATGGNDHERDRHKRARQPKDEVQSDSPSRVNEFSSEHDVYPKKKNPGHQKRKLDRVSDGGLEQASDGLVLTQITIGRRKKLDRL